MSVLTNKRLAQYDGNGAGGPYIIDFPVNVDDDGNAEDIEVIITDADGSVVDSSEYTITINGLNVTEDQNYGSGYEITIYRETPLTQPIDYEEAGEFSLDVLEKRGLDRLTFMQQERYEEARRAVQIPISDYGDEVVLPAKGDRINRLLAGDDDGNLTTVEKTYVYLNDSDSIMADLTIDANPKTVTFASLGIIDGDYYAELTLKGDNTRWLQNIAHDMSSTGITIYVYRFDIYDGIPKEGLPIKKLGSAKVGDTLAEGETITITAHLRKDG